MRYMRFLTLFILTIVLTSHAFTAYECEYSEINESRECSEKSESEETEKFEKELIITEENQSSFHVIAYTKGFFNEPSFHISDVFYDILIPPPDLA